MHWHILRHRKTFPWLHIIKVVVVLIPIWIFVSLINDHIFFSRTLNYMYKPGSKTQAVHPQTPNQLLKTADSVLKWRISVDNFVFNVTIPRLIEAVRICVQLDPGTQSYIALTASGAKGLNIKKVIKAASLDTLSWRHVTTGNLTLWMRDKHVTEEKITTGTGKRAVTKTITTERTVVQYDSVDAFRANPPAMSSVGLVGVDRMAFATVSNYKPSTSPVTFNHTLRGSHQLYVYAANEDLKLSFDKIDLNRAMGADMVTIRVAKVADATADGRTWIKSITVGDDGLTGKEGIHGKSQPVVINIPKVTPGIYFIDISASDDVLLANFSSAQHDISFNGRVYLAEGLAYGQSLYTPVVLQSNGTSVTVAANHDQGKQDVAIAGTKVTVQDVKVNHVVSKLTGTTTIDIPKGDIIVTSDGLLSFGGTQLIPDGARGIDVSSATPDVSAVDYILADYVPNTSGTLQADQTYTLDNLSLLGKTLTFSIDSPGMQASGATLGLRDIRVTLVRGVFPWKKVFQKLHLMK